MRQQNPIANKPMAQSKPTGTVAQVQRARVGIAGPVPKPRSNKVSDYMHCRLSPYTHSGRSYIPDGAPARRLTKEIRMYYDVVIGSSGGFIMMGIPELPRGIIFKDLVANPDQGVVVGNATLSGSRQGPNVSGSWYGPVMPDWAIWAASSPAITGTINPWAASKIRIITQAYRIMYTGQSLSCAGTITVSENEFGVNDNYSASQAIVSEYGTDSVVDPFTFAAGAILQCPVTIQSSTNTLSSSSVITPVAQGSYFVLGRNSLQTTWTNAEDTFVLTENKTTAALAYVNGVSYASSAAWDKNFTPKMAVVSGMTPGTSVRVEMMMCVELEPMIGSSFREFASVPPSAPQQIVAAEKALSKMPIAGPLSWTDTIIDVATNVIKVGKAIAAVI